MGDNIRVAVRIRPFSGKERESSSKCILDVAEGQVCLTKPFIFYKTGVREKNLVKIDVVKTFSFDHVFWSLDALDQKFNNQADVYSMLGPPIVEDAFNGFNCCIFAYGQTGSGKTYTMLGKGSSDKDQEGIIPRLCHEIFDRIEQTSREEQPSTHIVVSYLEIYNEKVYDLLNPKQGKQNLKVREHPVLGPYVDGLKELAVTCYDDIEHLLVSGNRQRTVAATSMNIESSRSHAIFMLKLTQVSVDATSGVSGEKVSKVSLVDLAGSERASKSKAVGERLKEGSNINRSLSTLGLVIGALADQNSSTSTGQSSATPHIPYRDSVLTWLLRDCLGGNTRTVLVATLSPAEDNEGESLSTLRYADRAKRIVNKPVVNEDPTARIIRQLRLEVDSLKQRLAEKNSREVVTQNGSNNELNVSSALSRSTSSLTSLCDRIDASERLVSNMQRSWPERVQETQAVKAECQNEMKRLGIDVDEDSNSKPMQPRRRCFLMNLNADPALNETLVYYLSQPGRTRVAAMTANEENGGDEDSDSVTTIRLFGPGISEQHAEFEVDSEGQVVLRPGMQGEEAAYTLVNDSPLSHEVRLQHGDQVQFGYSDAALFRLNNRKAEGNNISKTNLNATSSSSPASGSKSDLTNEGGGESSNTALEAALKQISKQYEQELSDTTNATAHTAVDLTSSSSSSSSSASTSSNNLNTKTQVPFRMTKHDQARLMQQRLDEDKRQRRQRLAIDLKNLRRQLIRAHTMVYEANLLAKQCGVGINFFATLQIPPALLEVASCSNGGPSLLSEPAVVVSSPARGSRRTLALDEVGSVLRACRESLALRGQEDDNEDDTEANAGWQLASLVDGADTGVELVGVANLYLTAVLHTVAFTYSVPIVSTLGETCGRITLTLARHQENTLEYYSRSKGLQIGDHIRVHVTTHCVTGIDVRSVAAIHYQFWREPMPCDVQPLFFRSIDDVNAEITRFGDTRIFEVTVSEDFIEHVSDAALALRVFKYSQNVADPAALHSASIHNAVPSPMPQTNGAAQQSRDAVLAQLLNRWSEVTGRLRVSVQIVEKLSEQQRHFSSVPVDTSMAQHAGGVYQLTQGALSRRIVIAVENDEDTSGRSMPLLVDSIQAVQLGSVTVRHSGSEPLDSYQRLDLDKLIDRWEEALEQRTTYLDNQLRMLQKRRRPPKDNDSGDDEENGGHKQEDVDEALLLHEWQLLVAEKEVSQEPEPGCGLPGAELLESASRDFDGHEPHRPLIFLDLALESLATGYPLAQSGLAGVTCVIDDRELHAAFIELQPLVDLEAPPVAVMASLDSATTTRWPVLDRVPLPGDLVYTTLRLLVRLSHPTAVEVMLRKRICLKVNPGVNSTAHRSRGLLSSWWSSIGGQSPNPEPHSKPATSALSTSVTFDVVSHVPPASYDVARRSTLARLAAEPSGAMPAVDKFVQAVHAVESTLVIDRLRQQLALQRCIDAALGRYAVASACAPPPSHQINTSNHQIQQPSPPPPLSETVPAVVVSMDSLAATNNCTVLPMSPMSSMSPTSDNNNGEDGDDDCGSSSSRGEKEGVVNGNNRRQVVAITADQQVENCFS